MGAARRFFPPWLPANERRRPSQNPLPHLQAKDDADRAARLAATKAEREADLAKKTPYEEEMDLCDYLVNYLTTTYVAEEKKEEAAAPVPLVAEFNGPGPSDLLFNSEQSWPLSI